MKNEPRAMREIHEIREKLYEEMQTMTSVEFTDLVNRETAVLAKQYGFTIKHSSVPIS